MFRRQLGDAVFQECIRKYYAAYAGKNADTNDLEKIFEEVSGQDLSIFFRQWLYTPGLPQLYILWSYSEKDKKIGHDYTITKRPFQFSLKVESATLQVSKLLETFEIPAEKKPITLRLIPIFPCYLKEQYQK